MKKVFALVSALVISGLASIFGQSGSIVFEEVRKIEINLEGEMAHMMENMPKEQTSEKVLYFSPEATLYMEPEKKESEDEMSFEGEGGGMRIMMSSPDNKFFVDLAEGSVIEQREFMTRMFLIESEIEEVDWKITGEQRMIMDYACMEATRTDTAGIVTRAWFAPTFPAKGGPSRFCSLPGMVLEVNIDDGKQILVAKSVDMTAPSKDIFKKPKEGKKVTKEEFEEIVAEKMKEMGGEGSGGSTIMIRIKH